jgi:hypothetical protein
MKKIYILASALFLFLFSSIGSFPSVVSAQQKKTVTLQFDVTQAQKVPVGQKVTVPLLLNTSGVEIDSVQAQWSFSGATISDVTLESNAGIPFSEIKKEVTPTSGQLILTGSDPLTPFASTQPVVLARLSFVPQSAGSVIITFNAEETLIPSHDSSENVVANQAPQTVSVPASTPQTASSETPSTASPTEDLDGEPMSLPNQLPLMIGAGILALVVIGGVAMFLLKKRQQASGTSNLAPPPSYSPTMMATPSSAVPTAPVQSVPTPTVATVPPAQPILPAQPVTPTQPTPPTQQVVFPTEPPPTQPPIVS